MDLIIRRPSSARRRHRPRSASPSVRLTSAHHCRQSPAREASPKVTVANLEEQQRRLNNFLRVPTNPEVHRTQHERLATPPTVEAPTPPPSVELQSSIVRDPTLHSSDFNALNELKFSTHKVEEAPRPPPRIMISRPGESTTFHDVYRWLRGVMACGVAHSLVGLLGIGMAGALVPLRTDNLHFHCGFWGGLVFLMTGCLDIYAAWRCSRRLLTYSFLCAILACAVGICLVGIGSYAVAQSHSAGTGRAAHHKASTASPKSELTAQSLPLFGVLCFCGFLEIATSVANIVFTKMIIHIRIYNFD